MIPTFVLIACKACKEGWLMQPEEGGCVDIDECAENKANCTKNQFCVNNEGSFSCLGKFPTTKMSILS